jgi:hypothetical protein
MVRYRIRIVLLSLGVVLGYSSAFSRLFYGRPLFGHRACGAAAEHASARGAHDHGMW